MIGVEEVTLLDLRREVPNLDSNAATLFGAPIWLETVLRNKSMGGAFRIRALIAREGHEPCGYLLGSEFRVPGFRAFFSPLPRSMSQYGGLTVLGKFEPVKEKIVNELMWAVHESYDAGFVITAPGERFIPTRAASTWTVTPRKSLAIDLTRQKDQIWSNVHGQARKGIKRALKNGVTVDFVSGLAPLPQFFRMMTEVATRTDWNLSVGEAFFTDALERFKENSIIARALSEGDFVAGAILFYDTRTLYCHSFAANAKGRKLQAADLLQWTIMNWGKEKGFQSYDLMGANIPRIAHFKRSLGATEIQYDAVAFSRNPLLARLERWGLDSFL